MGKYRMATIRKISAALHRQPLLLVLCMAVYGVGSSSSAQAQAQAQAQGWQIEPVFRLGFVADDNPNLSTRTDEEIDLTGYLLDARADINYASSDITSFFFQPRALIRTYPSDSSFDSDDLFLRSSFRHRARLSTFGFRVNYDQQSVRTAERSLVDLGIDDPDEISDDDTGRVGLDGDRSKWRLSPYWNIQLSNTSAIELGLDYFDTSYDEIFADLLVDYTDTRVNLSHQYTHSSKTSSILTLTGRQFVPDDSSGDNTGFGLLAGFERIMSEKTRLLVMFGAENTEQSLGQSDVELIGDVILSRELEIISMFAQYKREVTGTGSGSVEVRDTVNMNFNRRLNERISAGLGVRAYHAEPVGSLSSTSDRNYVQLQTQFTWYLSRAFVIEAEYRYTVLDRSNALGERANSNELGIWFVYQPKTIPKL